MADANSVKVSSKYIFLHLFVIVMLYMTVVNFLILIFQSINLLIPDPLVSGGYYIIASHGMIRFAIAAMVVAFPLLIWLTWLMNKYSAKNPAIGEMKIKKVLTYLTIFAAGLLIVGDLVGVVWTFLGGEITLRFVLKALAILLVSAAVFGYYLWDARRVGPSKLLKYFAWGASVVVLAAIVAGFILIGSPQKERIRRFDLQRVNDLQSIQAELINYWTGKQAIPSQLTPLEDSISGYKLPVDPETKLPYEYSKTGDTAFQLCAIFGLPADDSSVPYMVAPAGGYSQNWGHAAGRVCFDRTIDKALYPPKVIKQ